MIASVPESMTIAVEAMHKAEESLVGLPSTPEVRELQRRWYALRSVVHGIVITGVPTLTRAQESKLTDSAVALAKEVAEARRRLRP